MSADIDHSKELNNHNITSSIDSTQFIKAAMFNKENIDYEESSLGGSENQAIAFSKDGKSNSENQPLNLNNHQASLLQSLGAEPFVSSIDMSSLAEDQQALLDPQGNFRKTSQADSELNVEEMLDDEADIRRKINQKLIRNTIIQGIDKRSRSETPDKMSATEVLYRAHQKLAEQSKLKESPQKLLEKHQQRQKKAEELRSQIEMSKKNWYEKIRIRQQVSKERWLELLAEKKAKLQDKLEQAEERRQSEIQQLINKAQQEIQKIDETNYIVRMTQNNMKLELNMRMNETSERRNMIMEQYKRKKQKDRTLKEEAAEKRRQELQRSTENKLLKNQQRREQADQRRNKMIEEKKRAAQEADKRTMVLQRKNNLGDKIIDVMSFVNNSECIWEFLGNERDWQELGAFSNNRDDNLIFELLQKDQLEIEKLKLKKDAELLNLMIVITDSGEVFSNKEYIPLARRKYGKHADQISDSSSDEYEDYDYEKDQESVLTPEKLKRISPMSKKHLDEESKSQNAVNSDCGSDKASIPEEAYNDDIDKQQNQDNQDQFPQVQYFTEDIQNYMLYSLRLKMSMKRNILKKNLSEDLTWADFLKNESYQTQSQMYPIRFRNQAQTRSMRSTPERKQEVPSESENNLDIEIQDSSSSIVSKSNQKSQDPQKINLTNQAQNTSSSSNLSEKSRISSVVYPSKKKKNPKNTNQIQQQQLIQQDLKASGSMNSFKRNSGGSNQSSTQSLQISNSFVETPLNNARKSTQLETDSARKKGPNARMHSSSVQETSHSQTIHQLNTHHSGFLLTEEHPLNDNQSLVTHHTGSQMNQLIANTKPVLLPASSKVLPKKLTANATKILFPIREQKLLIKRPGKEGQFGKFKVLVKMEDLQIQKAINQTSLNQTFTEQSIDEKIPVSHKSTASISQISQTDPKETLSTGKKSNQNTPSQGKRRESLEGAQNNSFTLTQNQDKDKDLNTTPSQQQQQTSRLLQIQQKFWEKHGSGISGQQMEEYKDSRKLSSVQNSLPSESSLSPPKREVKIIETNTKPIGESIILLNQTSQTATTTEISSVQMNEQGYKELLIKYLMVDYIHLLKTDDSQKSIATEGQDADKLIDYLELNECNVRYCRLCDLIIPEHMTNEAHTQNKPHKKSRDELGIKESEDLQFSILSLISQPGDIEKELLKEKEKALKRKVKRIKAQMIAQAVSHESASYNPGKEYNSPNKKRLQILCIDLEKQVIPIINNYETLENILKELIKILDMRKQADLHLMRKLKYIPILIEICKRISVCHKNEFKHLGRVLEFVIKIINIFCGLRENRNYMLQTNRMLALIELLNWCLNRPTQLFYGINFLQQLFHILTLHVKHRAPYECQQMKEMFIEYLVCSQITMKIKSKFTIINGPLDLSEMMGQVPLFLLKSASFIESLTGLLQMDSVIRPVYEKSTKIGEHIIFVIQNTELFGIIPMITTILLTRNQPFKPSQQQINYTNKVLPQTLLSLAIASVKILNNVLRMDYRAAQQMMSDFEIQEQLYHLFNYLLYYSVETADQQEDSKELLHETLLLIGYFTLMNEKHQSILCKGENTLLQKLCNLPFPYFCDKKLKEILFPTLIQASYKNDRCLAIMDQEISIEMLVDFIQMNLKEELPKIVEEIDDYHSISSLGGAAAHQVAQAVERRTRSPSQSSRTSSQCSSMQFDVVNGNSPFLPLYMRFPKKLWKDAIAFYSKVLY